MRSRQLSVVAGLALIAVSSSVSAVITVDGDLADWGVTVQDCVNGCSSSSAKVGSTYSVHSGILSMIEDTNDRSNNYFLGPNSGGQNYDAQFLGVALVGDMLNIGISSGQRPDNGFSRFAPGDVRLSNDTNAWGIEVGGGRGNADTTSAPFSIEEGAAGSTYQLDRNGYTTGHSAHNSGQVAGSIWEKPGLLNDPIAPQGPTQITSGGSDSKNLGLADYIFKTSGTQHSVIELAFDIDRLGLARDTLGGLKIEWFPSCGNDELMVTIPSSSLPSLSVPEPSTIVLMGLGLAGIGCRRLRSKNAA